MSKLAYVEGITLASKRQGPLALKVVTDEHGLPRVLTLDFTPDPTRPVGLRQFTPTDYPTHGLALTGDFDEDQRTALVWLLENVEAIRKHLGSA